MKRETVCRNAQIVENRRRKTYRNHLEDMEPRIPATVAGAADNNGTLKYPRAVFIILAAKLLERVAFYGFRGTIWSAFNRL